jgi:hypothetical protein
MPEGVAQAAIADLWPGEVGVCHEAVEEAVAKLAAGQQIDPVTICTIGGRTIVTDGNNRVRAAVVYADRNRLPVTTVPCVTRTATIGPTAQQNLPRIAGTYGQGPAAFLKLPLVGRTTYDEEMEELQRKVLS